MIFKSGISGNIKKHPGIKHEVKLRRSMLKSLKKTIKQYERELLSALNKDLGKPKAEALISEILPIYKDIKTTITYLEDLMAPEKVSSPLLLFPGKAYRYPEPYGHILIISPWNYPVALSFIPLIGAIAAGNRVTLKPSEISSASTRIIEKIIKRAFPDNNVSVKTGGVEETTELLNTKFDYIFFTGSTNVGKIVMKAASDNLTPVTLELGGKSPCIIDKNVNIKKAARRIAFGKCFNAGQTCIAPDYLLIHKDVKHRFITEFKNVISSFYSKGAIESNYYAKIINERHFNRITEYLNDVEIISGGNHDKKKLKIEPTLVTPINDDIPVMKEEIFGPLLPIIEINDIDEAIGYINYHPKPLALYIFTNKKSTSLKIIKETSSGGVTVNNTLSHYINPNLPFGGIGDSGIGKYHGKETFKLFSHYKSVQYTSKIDIKQIYPPYKIPIYILKKIYNLMT